MKISDRIHLHSLDGTYEVLLIKEKTVVITCHKWQARAGYPKKIITKEISLEDIKGIANPFGKMIPVDFNLPYKVIRIPKKKAGLFRTVYSLTNKDTLKKQRDFLKLKDIKKENQLSVLKTVQCHVGKKFIYKFDIKNAFQNLEVDKHVTEHDVLKHSISKEGVLMQGTPCAAYIFESHLRAIDNKICLELDGLKYTRYIDDITISSDKEEDVNMLEDTLSRNLKRVGLSLNVDKTVKKKTDEKGFEVHGIFISQNRMGVRKLKEKMFLCAKHGEDKKAWGIYGYISQFCSEEQNDRNKKKLERYF